MPMKQNTLLQLVVLPLLLLLGILTVLTYSKFRTFISYAHKAEHTRVVLTTLDGLLVALKDAETNQRGFLLTRDSTFLSDFRHSRDGVTVWKQRLDASVENGSTQQANIDRLNGLVDRRVVALLNVLTIDRPDAGSMKDSVLYGRYLMDSVIATATRLRNAEQKELDGAQLETKSLIAVTPMFLLVLSLFTIAILFAGYIVLARQLRMRQQAQSELENKVQDLNRSNRELEQFAYVASHDLQEPLRKIQTFGDRLVHRYRNGLNEDIRTGLLKIQAAAARMQTLIDDLLGYSRVLHVANEFVPTDLSQVVNDVLSDMEVSIQNKAARVSVDPLPALVAVPSQMHQLFQNLLSNAIKFSKPTVTPTVHVSHQVVKGNTVPGTKPIERAAMFHKISVEDNGIGFDQAYTDKIFVIFQQLHNKMEFGGTGIGLAVCKKIVENHGGYIAAESKPGVGSTFTFYLPATER
jgi:signal transduction histidine kinase